MKIISKKIEKRIVNVSGSAPDIDTDILSRGRDKLIQYLIDKHGYNNICQVVTYGEIKIKSGFKELIKLAGTAFKEANYLTSTLPEKAADELKSRTEFFKYCQETPKLKNYTKEHVDVINDVFLIYESIRNTGQHAAAIIQTPKFDSEGNEMNIWDWFPVKKVDGHLVSEWTGTELDKLGFLKNDFLGLSQIDKVKDIFDLVKKNKGIDLELGKIPLDDEKTYLYFQEGFTQDVFQFSSDGMTSVLMDLFPENIEHLVASNALYRPGAMDFIPDYIKLRHGEKLPQFVPGTEKSLKDTYGKMIYQENMMAIAKEYAGMSDSESDDLRKACGKKISSLMAEQKAKFLKGAESLNRNVEDANNLWNIIEKASTYMFNKCISGDEMIYRGSGGRWKPTIHEMYMIKNNREYAKLTNHLSLHGKYKMKGYGLCFSLNKDNKLVKNKIIDIRYEGKMDIYRVTLKNGTTIDVTLNHKFPTNNGLKKLEDIDILNDQLFYREKGLSTSLQKIASIEFLKNDRVYDVEVNVPYHNFCTHKNVITCNSHSVSYAELGYTAMYLKAHYPEEFYSVSLQYASDSDKPKTISEMNKLGEVKVLPPNINESGLTFSPNFETKKIYWSLVSVKCVGEKAIEKIIEERNKNGSFFSVKDLIDRIDGRSVNKRAVTNLIISGAFDEVYNIKNESDRAGILREYYNEVIGEDLPDEFKDYHNIVKSHFWIIKARELTGLGYINYKEIVPDSFDKKLLIDTIKFQSDESRGTDIVVAGIIIKMIERQSKRGKFLTMQIDHNSYIIDVILWNETYEKFKKDLRNSDQKIIFMNGVVKFDSFKKKNGIQSIDKTKVEIL